MGQNASLEPLSLRGYARHRESLGLAGGTLRAVQVAIRDGRLSKSVTPEGKIASASAADAEWLAMTMSDRIPLTGPTAVVATPEYAESRARREAAEAALSEIELAEKRGELVLASEVQAKLVSTFHNCKTKLLAVPSLARQRDPTLTTEQVDLIEQVVREALEDLSGTPKDD